MPAGWRVQAVGRSVHFEVPASAAKGVFQLAHSEALVAGIALIRGSERARVLDNTVDDDLDDVSEPNDDTGSNRPESDAAGLGYEIRDY